MKICFLTGEYPPMQGGVADHTSYLARYLFDLGAEVSILTSSKAASPLHSSTSHPQVYPLIVSWGPGCWRQIGRWLREHRPQVLHIQYQAAAFDLGGWVNWLPWWLRRQHSRPPIVVTFHDLRVPYLFPKAGRLRWQSILALARYSDAVIVTNAEDEQRLQQAVQGRGRGQVVSRRLGETDAPWLTRIPLGSNVELQPPSGYLREKWRADLGIDSRTFLLAYFGFLNESKGGEELIQALAHLVHQGYDARLLMIGGQVGDVDPTNRAYLSRVQSLVQTCGLAGRVHWTSYITPQEVSANLLAADAVVMPYRDGVSFRRTTFIAALRHARPVVTTYSTVSLPELSDGDNVLLVPPRDATALAKALARLAEDAHLRRRLSAGAEALGKQFEWTAITQRTLDLYRRLGFE